MVSIATEKVIGNGSKLCGGASGCGKIKPYSEFYVRPTYGTLDKPAVEDHHFGTECKACMRKRSTQQQRTPSVPPWESTIMTENLAIKAFQCAGIWTTTGKATNAPFVDLVCRGMVWVEVKQSKLLHSGYSDRFLFRMSDKQRDNGFSGHVVMLICEWPDGHFTYHLFHADDPVFYGDDGRVKSGISFTPGKTELSTVGRGNKHQLTQQVMDEAQDRFELIATWQEWIERDLKDGDIPTYGKPFAR